MAWKERKRNFVLPLPPQRIEPGPIVRRPYSDPAPRPQNLVLEEVEAPLQKGPIRKMPDYTDLIEIRERDIENTKGTPKFLEGEDKWFWIKQDHGAWDGPASDWHSSHETKFFKHLKKKHVVVTAGANQGMYVRFYAKAFQKVYAFEPDPVNFHVMSMNNQAENVVKMQMALGNDNKLVMIERNGWTNTGTWHINRSSNEGNVPMIRLDTLCLPELDLLQLDVEGYEIDVLKGAQKTIERCQPVIIAENGNTPQIQDFLKGLGYKDVDQSCADTIWTPA
jgi:FkbM family methyltransferase